MITKRLFLAGSAAMAAAGRGAATAAASPEPASVPPVATVVLQAQSTDVHLSETGTATTVVRLAVSGNDPVIRVKKGQELLVQLANDLTEPASIRWDGLRGLGASNDALTAMSRAIGAGERRLIRFTPLDSGTSWFHAVPTPFQQTARGLRGVLIVDEPEPPAVDEELVLMMADWRLSEKNDLLFGSEPSPDLPTTKITVNGAAAGETVRTTSPGSRIRLRLLNGSVQRVMVVVSEGAHMTIVAIDGQPADMFQPIRDTIPIGPGARFDCMVDLPANAGADFRLSLKGTERALEGLEPDRTLFHLRTYGPAKASKPPLVPLPSNPALPVQIPLEASKRAELTIDRSPDSSWTVNGITGVPMPQKPVLKVKRGDVVTLGLTNKSDVTVPLKVAGHAMRLLHAKDDGWEPYWRDCLLLPPASRNHVAFIADVAGQWPIEAGFDDLALKGLCCWFEVSAPS